MALGLAEAKTQETKSSSPRQINILVIDQEESLLSAMWHALDSDGWQIRAAAEPGQVLPALASQDWTVVIANVAITGLAGPIFETLKALSQAPAIEEDHHRARVLFLVPEENALESRAVLEIARLPYTCKPINLHDLLEKVSDLMLEAQALTAPIRQVRHERGRKRGGKTTRVFNNRQMPSMIAPREDYTFTEEELAEFEAQEAAQRALSCDKKKDPKDLGAPVSER